MDTNVLQVQSQVEDKMETNKIKPFLPYTGLPVLLLTLVIRQLHRISPVLLLLQAVLIIGVYIASVYDIREKRIPNQLVLMLFGGWVLVMVPQLFFHTEETLYLMLNGVIGFFLGGIIFLVVYVVSRKGLGGGDVKLMAVSGLFLGADGVLPAMLYGSVFAAIAGGTLILLKKMGPKDAMPLVPALFAGMLLCIFF